MSCSVVTQRNNNSHFNNILNNNPFSNPQSVQPSSPTSSSSFPSSFMDGCVRRMSKLELEKIKFQASLEEERKKQISCFSA